MKRERAVTLKDGTLGIVRPIVPMDRDNLLEAFEDLAEDSRERRFFYGKSSISSKELERLSNPDGKDHIAFGLEVRTGQGDEMMPIAVARCFRDSDDAELAEIAVVTADAWQGLGAGAELMRSLSAAASDVGIRRWFAQMFTDNLPMRRLLAKYGRKLEESEISGGAVEVIYEIAEPPCGFFGG